MDEDTELQKQNVSEHVTDFFPDKGDANGNPIPVHKREKLQRLRLKNTDEYSRPDDDSDWRYSGSWRDENVAAEMDALRLFRTVAAHCELAQSVKARAEKLFCDVPAYQRRDFGTTGVALAVCIYALNEVTHRWDPNAVPDKKCFLHDVSREFGVHPAAPYYRLTAQLGDPSDDS